MSNIVFDVYTPIETAFSAVGSGLLDVDSSLFDQLLPGIISFAGLFLAVWGVWVGIRAILRSGRLVK